MKVSGYLLTAVAVSVSWLLFAQAPQVPVLDAAQKKQAVESLSQTLKEHYVFPEVAQKTAEFIGKQLDAGAYDKATDARTFAMALTEDLQSAAKDRHLRVGLLPPGESPLRDDTPEALERMRQELQRENFAFQKVEILPGNIGYLDLRLFAPPQFAGETAVAAMNFLAHCDALIFDLRKNGGGEPAMIQLLSTYLFEEPTHLNDLYWRKGDQRDQFWTLPYAPGPRLAKVPVYILTSASTFSGAEEFTNNLKVLKRATVVGETTGGGANPGEGFPVAPFFQCFVPLGRAINPTTGSNWEGTGVEPDLKVPAAQALAVAHTEALRALRTKATDPAQLARYDWALEALEAVEHPAVFTAKELEAFAGAYGPRKVWVEKGKLLHQRPGRPPLTLVPFTGTTFSVEGADQVRFTFVRDEKGAVVKVVLTYDNGTRDESAKAK